MKKEPFATPSKQAFFSLISLFFISTLCLILAVLSPIIALAVDATFQWDSSDRAIGYKLRYGIESQSYDSIIDVGSRLEHTVTDLNDDQRYYFVVTAYNEFGESSFSEELVIEPVLNSQNQPPAADAGPDQIVNEFARVTLNGSNSTDPDDGIASFFWEQIEGQFVDLTNQREEAATFTAPDVGSTGEALIFKITVTDYGQLVSSDTCVVNVSSLNNPPVADAGPDRTVSEGELVSLDASNSSDQDDGIKSYQWTQISGTPVELSVSNPIKPTFIAPNVSQMGESLKFQVTVADNGGLQAHDNCIVNISWTNDPPTSDAGPDQIVKEGELVSLNGSGSKDNDDGIASIQWSQSSGPPVNLSSPAVYQPTFKAPEGIAEDTSLKFNLTISDHYDLQSQDSCTVTVNPVLKKTSDTVQIIEALYNESKKKLVVKATTDAPAKSVILTVWADFDGLEVKLGELRYNRKRNLYRKVFRRTNSKPNNITIKSSGGGIDIQPCS